MGGKKIPWGKTIFMIRLISHQFHPVMFQSSILGKKEELSSVIDFASKFRIIRKETATGEQTRWMALIFT